MTAKKQWSDEELETLAEDAIKELFDAEIGQYSLPIPYDKWEVQPDETEVERDGRQGHDYVEVVVKVKDGHYMRFRVSGFEDIDDESDLFMLDVDLNIYEDVYNNIDGHDRKIFWIIYLWPDRQDD